MLVDEDIDGLDIAGVDYEMAFGLESTFIIATFTCNAANSARAVTFSGVLI